MVNKATYDDEESSSTEEYFELLQDMAKLLITKSPKTNMAQVLEFLESAEDLKGFEDYFGIITETLLKAMDPAKKKRKMIKILEILLEDYQ